MEQLSLAHAQLAAVASELRGLAWVSPKAPANCQATRFALARSVRSRLRKRKPRGDASRLFDIVSVGFVRLKKAVSERAEK